MSGISFLVKTIFYFVGRLQFGGTIAVQGWKLFLVKTVGTHGHFLMMDTTVVEKTYQRHSH